MIDRHAGRETIAQAVHVVWCMKNPWLGLQPVDGRIVHPDDDAIVEAFNRRAPPDYQLLTTAWPQPWAGPIDKARVLILSANPGWSPG